jgi:hypothetical protein
MLDCKENYKKRKEVDNKQAIENYLTWQQTSNWKLFPYKCYVTKIMIKNYLTWQQTSNWNCLFHRLVSAPRRDTPEHGGMHGRCISWCYW